MKKINYYQLSLIIILSSLISIFFVNYTYDKLENQLESKITLKENELVVGDYNEQYFNFDRTIFNTIDKIRLFPNLECNFIKDVNPRPISITSNRGIYIIKIFNPNKSDNENCFNYILDLIKFEFIKTIQKKVDQLNMQQSIRLKALDDLDSEKITLEAQRKEKMIKLEEFKFQTKKIIFSDFLELVKNNKVREVGITEDFITGLTTNNEKFYTVSKDLSNSDFVIEYFFEKGLDFYFIDEDYSKNKVYREVYNRQTIEDQVKLSFYKNKITQSPSIISEVTHEEIRLGFKIYTLIILILFNIVGIIIFLLINRTYLKPLFNYLKKIS